MNKEAARKFLENLGYLPRSLETSEEVFEYAVREFQITYNLKDQKGSWNKEVKDAAKLPRCGFHDKIFVVRERETLHKMELKDGSITIVRAKYLKGDSVPLGSQAWPKVKPPFNLFYDFRSDISKDYKDAIGRAMERWMEVKDSSNGDIVYFKKATKSSRLDVLIGWTGKDDVDYDLGANIIAKACLPCMCKVPLEVSFDGADGWVSVGSSKTAFNIETVAIHELGHILGLPHPAKIEGCTMDPVFREGELPNDIHPKDQKRFRSLYKNDTTEDCP